MKIVSAPVQSSDINTIVFYDKSVYEFVIDNVNIGDVVKDIESGITIGKVSKIQKFDEEEYKSDKTGQFVRSPRGDFLNLVNCM